MRPTPMNRTIRNASCLALAALLGGVMLVSPAQAQSDDGAPPPPRGGKGGGAGFGGPPVPPDAGEAEGDFGGQRRGGRGGQEGGMRGRMMEIRVWKMTFDQMKPSLNAEQQAKAAEIEGAFAKSSQAWMDANGDRLKELGDRMREARESGSPDPALMQEMQALNESRPKPEASQKQIFALLTPEQQHQFKTSLDENMKKARERMGRGGPEGRGGKGGKGRGGKPGGPPPKDDAPPMDGDGNPPPPPMDE
jgi:Spy/CpxP family protein refolding chaperone